MRTNAYIDEISALKLTYLSPQNCTSSFHKANMTNLCKKTLSRIRQRQ